jgi:hypothetical protein
LRPFHDRIRLAIAVATALASIAVPSAAHQDPAPSPAPAAPAKPEATAKPIATGAPAAGDEKPAPPPFVLEAGSRFDLQTYEAALGRLAAAYPDLLRVRSLGKSRGGRDVWMAVAADDAAGDAGRRPAAVVITDLAPIRGESAPDAPVSTVASPRIAGPEAALFALASVLERARADPRVRERLQRCALYFLPAPDPDSAFPPTDADATPAPRRSRLDRNFPSGWEPFDADSKASGPYPLCEPESQLLARFLLERMNLSMVLSLGGGREREGADGKASAEPPSESATAAGSLESYCREVLDAVVLRPTPWAGANRAGTLGTAPEGFFATATLVEKILGDLPRLECGSPKVERLRPDVWLVDLPLSNAGSLSTVGRKSRAGGTGDIQLQASGGRVVACAVETGAAGTYEAVRGARGAWPLSSLEGHAQIAVRLVVQGEEGASLEAVFESPRSGRAHVSVSLR